MSNVTAKLKVEKDVLDAAATRARLESMLARTFDPDTFGPQRLHASETARFIAEQIARHAGARTVVPLKKVAS